MMASENVDIKTKVFRSKKQSNDSRGDGIWKKYIMERDVGGIDAGVQYPNSVEFVCGIEYRVDIYRKLSKFMKSDGFDSDDFKLMLQSGNTSEFHGVERITAINAFYIPTNEKSGLKLTKGSKTTIPPLLYAVETGNSKAVEALLQHGVDPHERMTISSLLDTSINITTLSRVGGESFQGAETILNTFQDGKQSKARSSDVTCDSSTVPGWGEVDCKWSEPNVVEDSMTPFQLAFDAHNLGVMETFLKFDCIASTMTGELTLRTTKLSGGGCHLPDNFARLTALTTLTIVDPSHKGSVPLPIFSLLALRNLSLCGSGYTSIPEDIAQLANLESLDVSNMNLTALPLVSLSRLAKLTSVDCTGIKLASPPIEIVRHGPAAVARYIRDLGEGVEQNTDVLLMLIGDGEAGKTSTLRALRNTESNTALAIQVDDRTIGIDISEFKPSHTSPLKFFAWDFGGQGVYAIMQQLFLSRRAVYPLLWRIRQSLDVTQLKSSLKCDVCSRVLRAHNPEHQQSIYRVEGQGLCHSSCVSFDSLISSWMERLQFRVPGVTVVLIATHIDCAAPHEVDEQVEAVRKVVERVSARQRHSSSDIAPLRIHNDGQSIRISNTSGEGVSELRDTLISIAEGLDSYSEVVPSSYVKLRQKLREMQVAGPSHRTWMLWTEYQALAEECGISDEDGIGVVTEFLHDIGELRYFGLKNEDIKLPSELLKSTVFPNPFWIVDVLRGVIRHEHSGILDLIKNDEKLSSKMSKTLRRRVYRLMQRGLLHESLLPYIWSGIAGNYDDDERNQDEFKRLISLLRAFNILMDKPGSERGKEWIIPCLASGRNAHSINEDDLVDDTLPFVGRLVYDALPPFFDMILVAHVMNTGIAESVDFIEGAAVFRHLSDRVLLFAGLGKVHDPTTVFRVDQIQEGGLRKVLREDQSHVVVAASSRNLLVGLIREIDTLEKFFPGLCRMCTVFPCFSCRSSRQKAGTESSPLPPHDNEEAALSAKAKLAAAEAQEKISQEALLDVAEADALGVEIFFRLKGIKRAWQVYPELSELLSPSDDEEYNLLSQGRNWARVMQNMVIRSDMVREPSYIQATYNAGRLWPSDRFFKEVNNYLLAIT